MMLYTIDPVPLRVENITIDTYTLEHGFRMRTNCNYPEAYVTPIVYINNMKVTTSRPRTNGNNPTLFGYSGPGNVTAINVNMEDVYATVTVLRASFVVSLEGT